MEQVVVRENSHQYSDVYRSLYDTREYKVYIITNGKYFYRGYTHDLRSRWMAHRTGRNSALFVKNMKSSSTDPERGIWPVLAITGFASGVEAKHFEDYLHRPMKKGKMIEDETYQSLIRTSVQGAEKPSTFLKFLYKGCNLNVFHDSEPLRNPLRSLTIHWFEPVYRGAQLPVPHLPPHITERNATETEKKLMWTPKKIFNDVTYGMFPHYNLQKPRKETKNKAPIRRKQTSKPTVDEDHDIRVSVDEVEDKKKVVKERRDAWTSSNLVTIDRHLLPLNYRPEEKKLNEHDSQ